MLEWNGSFLDLDLNLNRFGVVGSRIREKIKSKSMIKIKMIKMARER